MSVVNTANTLEFMDKDEFQYDCEFELNQY